MFQDLKIEDAETKHLILVHGGGFGAWCWYKIITLLVESGFTVDAVDLTGSGIHSSDTNTIMNLSQYTKPLTDIFHKLHQGEKVCHSYPHSSPFTIYYHIYRYIDVFSDENQKERAKLELKSTE